MKVVKVEGVVKWEGLAGVGMVAGVVEQVCEKSHCIHYIHESESLEEMGYHSRPGILMNGN